MEVPRPPGADDTFEQLLAECIELYAERGGRAVDELSRRHPEHGDKLRERMSSLQRMGLLADVEAPRKVGPYRILGRLGQGGMSTVFLAEDARLGRRVALKLGHAALAADDRASLRFEREIRAVLKLQHPCIVQTFDVGQAEGRSYFTMEYVEGTTLARVIESLKATGVPPVELTGASIARAMVEGEPTGAAPPDEARPAPEPEVLLAWRARYVEVVCRLVLDVADALAHAHSHGIVHRDVKPSNIMVRPDGRAQLFDLGLALLLDQPALSASGDFAGTPFYASPEQISGRRGKVDGRSDVYALGVTLYELLTLERPFESERTAELVKKIQVEEPRSPRARNSDVPRDLETITLAALEKDPAQRYESAEAMAADLRRFLELRPIHAQPRSPLERSLRQLKRNPALATLAAVALLLLLGLPVALLGVNSAIRKQRDRAATAAVQAEHQAELNAEVTEFLVELYHLAGSEAGPRHLPTAAGGAAPERSAAPERESIDVLDFLERGVRRISTDFEDQPLVRAALLEATGRVYANLALTDEALPLLARSLAVRQRELGEDHVDTARLLALLGSIHSDRGELEAAQGLAARSLGALTRMRAAGDTYDGAVVAENRITLARCAEQRGAPEVARTEIARALDLMRGEGDGAYLPLAEVLEHAAAISARCGDHAQALGELREALAIRRRQWSPDPVTIARNLEAQAEYHTARREHDAAGRLRAEARNLLARSGGPPVGTEVAEDDGVPYPFDLTPWDASYDAVFRDGITALYSGNWDVAIGAFEQCIEWRPRHRTCAYNIACGHALSGNLEAGIAWWERAVDYGYGLEPYTLEVSLKDADLAPLRSDARWQRAYDRMASRRAGAEAYAATPEVYFPTSLDTGDRCPLIVLLHPQGSTPTAALDESWRITGERLGAAILAPCGRIPVRDDPREGMLWFAEADDFLLRSWYYEKPIVDAVHAFGEEHPLDRERVVVVGLGEAALLASDLALAAPGLFRGAVLDGGPVHPSLAPERVRIAKAVGIHMEILVPSSAPPARAHGSSSELAGSLERWLAAHELAGHARVRVMEDAGSTASERAERRVEALRALLDSESRH